VEWRDCFTEFGEGIAQSTANKQKIGITMPSLPRRRMSSRKRVTPRTTWTMMPRRRRPEVRLESEPMHVRALLTSRPRMLVEGVCSRRLSCLTALRADARLTAVSEEECV